MCKSPFNVKKTSLLKVMCAMGLHLEMSIISIFEVQTEGEPVKERRRTRREGKEKTTSAEKGTKNTKGEGKSRGNQEQWHNTSGKA